MIVYLLVGGVIGVLASVLVWIMQQLFAPGPTGYAIGVAGIYFFCACISFVAHARITFKVAVPMERFVRHLALASVSAVATGALSSALRTLVPASFAGIPIDSGMAAVAGFIAASLIIAVVSYLLARSFVFHAPEDGSAG